MMLRYFRNMSEREIEAARGRRATLTVFRNGVPEVRTGPLGRVTAFTVFVGAFCYGRREVEDSLRIEEVSDSDDLYPLAADVRRALNEDAR